MGGAIGDTGNAIGRMGDAIGGRDDAIGDTGNAIGHLRPAIDGVGVANRRSVSCDPRGGRREREEGAGRLGDQGSTMLVLLWNEV